MTEAAIVMTEAEHSNVDPNYVWMIRPCEQYHEEYKECQRFKARLFQEYIYGDRLDCEQWKVDRDNCLYWETKSNESAANAIIASEKRRRFERLSGHVKNTIWEKREKPLEDWNKPLPEFENRTKFSYLAQKARLSRGEQELALKDIKDVACSIQ